MTATYESLLAGSSPPGLYRWIGPESRDLAEWATQSGWGALSLDTSFVTDRESFYAELSTSWGLPAWFGNNLDALFDALDEIASVPTVLIWDGLDHLAAIAPDLTAAVIEVLRDCVSQAPAFAVVARGTLEISGFDELL